MNKRAFCIADHPRQQKWRFLDFTISLTNTVLFENVDFARDFNNKLKILIWAYNDKGEVIIGEKIVTVAGSWCCNRYDFGYIELDVPPQAAPDKPSLLNPSNGATVSSETDTVLKWSQAARATKYAVELYTPSGTRQSGRISNTNWNAGRLQPGNYTWRVEAYNSSGYSGWTDSFSFTVSAPLAAPDKPTPQSPINNITGVKKSWGRVEKSRQKSH